MYLAVDIGGTKTLLAVFDKESNKLEEVKFPTPPVFDEFIRQFGDALGQLTNNKDFLGCGIGMPGLVDRDKGISIWGGGNLTWENVPIAESLQKLLGCPCVVENDANLAGLSEAHLVKDSYRKVFYVTISTGIGGVYVLDGVIDRNTVNAEVGKMIFEHEGEIKLWEQFASGKWIVATYGKRASDLTDVSAWKVITRNMALGIINISGVLTPEVIIIGGGVGSHLERFKPYLDEAIASMKPRDITVPPIIQAQHAEEAVIYGAYELIKQQEA